MADNNTITMDNVDSVGAPGGILQPGWRAAVHLLEQRRRVLADQWECLATSQGADVEELFRLGWQATALGFAIGELREAARTMGLQL